MPRLTSTLRGTRRGTFRGTRRGRRDHVVLGGDHLIADSSVLVQGRHGPPAVHFISKSRPAFFARARGSRKRAMSLTASARLAGAFARLPFRTKARHCMFAISL